jgi:DNA-binding CsgD family transcriptional regulator
MKERSRNLERKATAMTIVVALQSMAALFFIIDVLNDAANSEGTTHLLIEALAVIALLVAVVVGTFQIRAMLLAARQDDMAVALIRGAAANLIKLRFSQWKLTKAEADVALFALKGCDVHQIAGLRGAADGTVRAQLTKIYAKAGVSSQSALIATFLDEIIDPDLLDPVPTPAAETIA